MCQEYTNDYVVIQQYKEGNLYSLFSPCDQLYLSKAFSDPLLLTYPLNLPPSIFVMNYIKRLHYSRCLPRSE